MDLDDLRAAATKLSPLAHIATVGADGAPDVAPVHPAWLDGSIWVMSHASSVKVKNLAAEPRVALHWQVSEAGDGVAIWGQATAHTDTETKAKLWTGVFDYDLDLFAPGGVDDPGVAMIEIAPDRGLSLIAYGMGGRDTWQASA